MEFKPHKTGLIYKRYYYPFFNYPYYYHQSIMINDHDYKYNPTIEGFNSNINYTNFIIIILILFLIFY